LLDGFRFLSSLEANRNILKLISCLAGKIHFALFCLGCHARSAIILRGLSAFFYLQAVNENETKELHKR
jgi:hypothetical protein